MATAPALLRGLSFGRLVHHHLRRRRVVFRILAQHRSIWRRTSSSSHGSTRPEENDPSAAVDKTATTSHAGDLDSFRRMYHPDYRKWIAKEQEILDDIRPITSLAKEILHSDRYMDGARLTAEDEKVIVEKLLAYHPHYVEKIGCGLDSIMVDRHPQFPRTRCLFVIRTDGAWIDFSYQKCIRSYIRHRYPAHAERFIGEHFNRYGYSGKCSYFGSGRDG